VALAAHPEYALVLASNRDEFFDRRSSSLRTLCCASTRSRASALRRPSEAVHWWRRSSAGAGESSGESSSGEILAGRDCVGGGSWLSLRPAAGRWSVVTNYRELPSGSPPSRGRLPLDFVEGDASPLAHLQRLQADAHTYSGFNLLCGDTRHGCVAVIGNRGTAAVAGPQVVPPGVHALSNGVFGDEWPKVARGRAVLSDILARWAPGAPPPTEELLTRLLGDASCDAADDALPRTCVTRAEERGLAPAFVAMDDLAGCGRRAACFCVQHMFAPSH
jgi:uncharacterized protein with NRDE domain